MRNLSDNELQLELEKAMRLIRMIETEIRLWQTQELEKEARKKMVFQREMAMRRANSLGFLQEAPPSLPQKALLGLNAFASSSRTAEIDAANMKRESEKLMVLPKPDLTRYEGKRKAGVEEKNGVNSEFKFESKKKAKEVKVDEEWRCELCNVMATSAKSLNDHFKGKKHMSKAKAQCLEIASQNSTNLSFEEVASSRSKMDAESETKEEEAEDDSVNSGAKSVKKR